jgi:hypothetical protein
MRKNIKAVAADGLDVPVAVRGDDFLDWDADLFEVVRRRLEAMAELDFEGLHSSRLWPVAWCCSSRHSRLEQGSRGRAERWWYRYHWRTCCSSP